MKGLICSEFQDRVSERIWKLLKKENPRRLLAALRKHKQVWGDLDRDSSTGKTTVSLAVHHSWLHLNPWRSWGNRPEQRETEPALHPEGKREESGVQSLNGMETKGKLHLGEENASHSAEVGLLHLTKSLDPKAFLSAKAVERIWKEEAPDTRCEDMTQCINGNRSDYERLLFSWTYPCGLHVCKCVSMCFFLLPFLVIYKMCKMCGIC